MNLNVDYPQVDQKYVLRPSEKIKEFVERLNKKVPDEKATLIKCNLKLFWPEFVTNEKGTMILGPLGPHPNYEPHGLVPVEKQCIVLELKIVGASVDQLMKVLRNGASIIYSSFLSRTNTNVELKKTYIIKIDKWDFSKFRETTSKLFGTMNDFQLSTLGYNESTAHMFFEANGFHFNKNLVCESLISQDSVYSYDKVIEHQTHIVKIKLWHNDISNDDKFVNNVIAELSRISEFIVHLENESV